MQLNNEPRAFWTDGLVWLGGGADGGEQGSRTDPWGRSGCDFQTIISPLLKLSGEGILVARNQGMKAWSAVASHLTVPAKHILFPASHLKCLPAVAIRVVVSNNSLSLFANCHLG